ncbi:MAG: PilZ domain-containing protein [Candidatus Omnitrophica bacterium]|nr:PilZ domain-containing protein [Candidatus Omnitrophota bacterium]
MENRRQFVRIPFYEPVGYQRQEASTLEGSLARDISQGGVKLRVNEFIALNTILELQIQLPGQIQLMKAHAKVVWARELPYRDDGWQVGLELIASESFSLAIRDYIGLRRFEPI